MEMELMRCGLSPCAGILSPPSNNCSGVVGFHIESAAYGEALSFDDCSSVTPFPFDMIVAADCVYDTAHAGMIRDCVKWSLKLPEVDNSGNILIMPACAVS
jgi:hypothetical protein